MYFLYVVIHVDVQLYLPHPPAQRIYAPLDARSTGNQ